MKIKKDWILGFIVGFLLISVVIIIKDYIKIRNDKLIIMKNDIVSHYYNKSKLKEVLKKGLGDNYKDDLRVDLDNYLITTMMKELGDLEEEKFKRYNAFMSDKRMKSYDEEKVENANKIEGEKIDEEIYLITLTEFCDGITYNKFKELIPEMENSKELVIDLRGNSGGGFIDLKKILSLFVDNGKTIYQLDFGDKKQDIISSSETKLTFDNIVLLIDNKTASVSEVFVLALRHNLPNVKVIGVDSYGKNISYSIRRFNDGSAMIFISSIMMGPNSSQISINGIEPDIKVGHNEEFYKSIQSEVDQKKERETDSNEQLEETINYLKGV